MIAFQQTLLAVNALLAVLFGIDYFVIGSSRVRPRTKALLGELLTGLFLAFLILLLLFALSCAVQRRSAIYLALSAYAVVPFAIGRLVSYRTLGFYAALQFLAFLLSAATLYVI